MMFIVAMEGRTSGWCTAVKNITVGGTFDGDTVCHSALFLLLISMKYWEGTMGNTRSLMSPDAAVFVSAVLLFAVPS